MSLCVGILDKIYTIDRIELSTSIFDPVNHERKSILVEVKNEASRLTERVTKYSWWITRQQPEKRWIDIKFREKG